MVSSERFILTFFCLRLYTNQFNTQLANTAWVAETSGGFGSVVDQCASVLHKAMRGSFIKQISKTS